MWVQLAATKYIEKLGVQQRYSPGDWVEVGKQTALLWLSEGSARIPDPAQIASLNPDGSGILTDKRDLMCKQLISLGEYVVIEEGKLLSLPFSRTVWIDSLLSVRPELIPVGLLMLDTWEIAVPLMDYKTLAIHEGTEQEREKTKQVIRDLRVPMYDTRLMFMKKTPAVTELLRLYTKDGYNPLSFLRAVYTVKPFILALPCTWTEGRRMPE